MKHSLGLVALLALSACATNRAITMPLTHPSPFQRWGRQLSVEPFDNDRAALGQRVAEGARASGTFDLATERAQLGLSGVVHHDESGAEQQGSRPYTCHRQVPEQRTRQVPYWVQGPTPPPIYIGGVAIPQQPQSRMEFRTETYTEMVDHPYACTQLVRWIEGTVSVDVRIIARTRPPQIVWQRSINLSDRDEQTGLAGADSGNYPPGPVSGESVLERLRGQVVAQVTAALVPRRESITFDFALGSDERFEQAMLLARAGDIEGAERLVEAIAQRFANPHSESERHQLAAAHFDRGALRGFAGRVNDSIADISRAMELHPEATYWGELLRVMRGLAASIDASRDRGETTRPPAAAEPEPARRAPAPRRAPPRGRTR